MQPYQFSRPLSGSEGFVGMWNALSKRYYTNLEHIYAENFYRTWLGVQFWLDFFGTYGMIGTMKSWSCIVLGQNQPNEEGGDEGHVNSIISGKLKSDKRFCWNSTGRWITMKSSISSIQNFLLHFCRVCVTQRSSIRRERRMYELIFCTAMNTKARQRCASSVVNEVFIST